ncbi:TIGR03617 family F420-dependent LLM class oxidoreductase [Alphaproteobacteria bacterium]|nr:TIGR03617 family F420-dependent LLM class oxidoreductase [Rhodospirillaceae bacterium]MDC0998529.1 TIGR03617 family F420-dependent LLM class oxidoreductase [Alphaproteobacteria bacterium]
MHIYRNITDTKLTDVNSLAPRLEGLGYNGLLMTELKHDPFLPLAVAATTTKTMSLATGIAISFIRSPMAVANIAWDLSEASSGRFTLGLGTQIRAHNEKRFSVPWSPPAPRMREYIQALKAIWRCWKYGDKLSFEGDHYRFTLMTPEFVPESSGIPLPPVTLAAVGPVMIKTAAEVADGIRLHGFCTAKYFEETIMPKIDIGLKAAGKTRKNFEISGGGFIATGPNDQAVDEAIETVRYRVGFYGSTPAYWPVLETHGYGDLGRKLNALTKSGKWGQLAEQIPDDLLQLFCAIGRYDEIAKNIRERFENMTDVISTGLNEDFPPDLIQDIQKIERSFVGFNTD